ncbi:hypothetical protein [Sphingomonas sp.]|uniref:hypothetical protein n=1 Tax=Sphingomonas sp. TaxID=28214 RepID=UPI003B3AB652
MAFLRTLFWIVVTVIVVVFSIRNWSAVTISLFGDLQADVKLPVLLLIMFLIGFVPPYAWHRAFRWRHARKLALVDRVAAPTVVPAASAASPAPMPVPPQPAYLQEAPASPPQTPDPFKAD